MHVGGHFQCPHCFLSVYADQVWESTGMDTHDESGEYTCVYCQIPLHVHIIPSNKSNTQSP